MICVFTDKTYFAVTIILSHPEHIEASAGSLTQTCDVEIPINSTAFFLKYQPEQKQALSW